MNQYEGIMLQSLREEILSFISEEFVLSLLVTILVVVLYIVAIHEQFKRCSRLIPIVIISGLFGIGRADLLMHRAGTYIASFEAQNIRTDAAWETFKSAQAA